jgi:aspartyl/asparaginyl beta-hydroxylase (cupin superfamily)
MYSILEPGKYLPPPRGPYNGVLRLHLGLIVPEPRDMLGIRVGNEIYRWREGEVVIFDDAYAHEAWNRTPHTRVVLFVDFRKPLRFPASMVKWLLLHLAETASMSAFGGKADMIFCGANVCFRPKADIERYSTGRS